MTRQEEYEAALAQREAADKAVRRAARPRHYAASTAPTTANAAADRLDAAFAALRTREARP